MATVTKPMALDETLKATNVALGLIKDAINATGAYPTADNVSYDNTVSGLDATNVQSAINELNSEKANIADIPTETSDLTNDSNFVSDSNYVHTDNNYTTTDKNIVGNVTSNLANKVDKVSGKGLSTNDFTTAYMNKLNGIASGAEVNVQSDWSQTTTTKDDYIKNKPTKLSDFTNDQNFIDNTVNNLTNYYLKSNTYTKTEVNNLISSIVTLNIVVVQALPTTNISQTTIYLVPKSTTQTNNAYDEYINLDGTTSGWEKIGNTEIDLSNYYTISQVDNLLSNKVDKASGKGLSTNDFTTTLKNKLDGIEANANNYSLPTSSSSVLGGIKIGSNLSIDSDGVVSATNTTYSDVTTTTHGLMTASDKVKLNGIESNANKYVLPIATSSALGGIKVGNNLSIDANGVVSATNTTYSDATTTTHGLMSATDKTKLNGIATGANKYTLPKATASALGGIKIGTNLSIDSNGVVSATDTKYSNATTSTSGLMSSTDKTKLNGIATGAEVNVQADWNETNTNSDSYIKNKPNIPSGVVVDTSLSTTSTNPVQNKVITTELNKKANASSVPTNSAIIDLIYPVGSIYTSTINKNPSTYFGGTWSSIGESYLIINNGTTNTTQYKWKRTA